MAVRIVGTDGEKLVLTQWEQKRKVAVLGLVPVGENPPTLRWAHHQLNKAIDVETEDISTVWYDLHPTEEDDPPPVFAAYAPQFVLDHNGPVLLSVIDHDSDGETREVATLRICVRPRMEPGN